MTIMFYTLSFITGWTLVPFASLLLLMLSTTGLQYCGMERSWLHVSVAPRGQPGKFWMMLTSVGSSSGSHVSNCVYAGFGGACSVAGARTAKRGVT